MSKFKKLHNTPMQLKLELPQKERALSTLVNETEPFFLDMPINVSIAVFKGHGFTASSTGNGPATSAANTSGFLLRNAPGTCQMLVCPGTGGRTPLLAIVPHIGPKSHGYSKKHPC